MIDAVAAAPQTVDAGDAILFVSSRIQTGCSARHEPGSGRFTLLKPGIYEITYTANVLVPAETKVTPITLGLNQDGETVVGSETTFTPPEALTLGSVSRTVLVRLYESCCCSSLSVVNKSLNTIQVQDANLVITRHC